MVRYAVVGGVGRREGKKSRRRDGVWQDAWDGEEEKDFANLVKLSHSVFCLSREMGERGHGVEIEVVQYRDAGRCVRCAMRKCR